MKKIIFFSVIVLFSVNSILAQGTCNSHVIKYDGPHNSNQVQKILNESTNPVLVSLDAPNKASIVANLEFRQGMPVGFSAMDDNLKKLVGSPTLFASVMGAILSQKVLVTTFENKPVFTEITMGEYQKLVHDDPIGNNPQGISNWCTNCNAPDSNVYKCCEVATDPRGCLDFFVVIGGNYYKVK